MSVNLQRVAWAIMLGSFVTFCALCAFTIYGVYGFLFESTVPMNTVAQASRGSIGITGADLREDVERGTRLLAIGNLVRPNDLNAQGVIVIQDPYRNNAFVASVAMTGGESTAAVRAAYRPRFDWGRCNANGDGYCINVTRASGEFVITIADDLPHGLDLELITEQRARVQLNEPGWYELDIRDNTISVQSHGGTALIFGPDRSFGYSVTSGSGSIYEITTDVLRARAQPVSLVENPELATAPESDVSSLVDTVPVDWRCSSTVEADTPRGEFSAEQQDGRHVIRIARTGTDKPGDTFCQQGLTVGETWHDIRGVSSLTIRTSLYVHFQSLGSCGVQGSECPLMIRLDYINGRGEENFIVYGFYAVPASPDQRFPQTCGNCIAPHIRVQEKAWYAFDSGNILAAFPADDRRPVAISRLRFYASGHEYDVRIGRMELLAEGPAEGQTR